MGAAKDYQRKKIDGIQCPVCGKRKPMAGKEICRACHNEREKDGVKKEYKQKKKREPKKCLRCGNKFWSEGNFNRICKYCRGVNTEIDNGLEVRSAISLPNSGGLY